MKAVISQDSAKLGYLTVKVKSGRRTLEILVDPSDQAKCSFACPAYHEGQGLKGFCQLNDFGPWGEVENYHRTDFCKESETRIAEQLRIPEGWLWERSRR